MALRGIVRANGPHVAAVVFGRYSAFTTHVSSAYISNSYEPLRDARGDGEGKP